MAKYDLEISIAAPKHMGSNLLELYQTTSRITRVDSIYLPRWPYPTLKSFSFPIDLGLKIKHMIKNGNFDLIHVHGHHYPISWLTINWAHKYGIPSVLTMHGMYALNPNSLGGKSLFEDMFNKSVFARTLSKVTSVIGLTDRMTNYAKKFGGDSINYFTIPNGVSTAVFTENMKRKQEYRKKYNIAEDKTVILFCGRFEKVKGIVEFATAVADLVKSLDVEVVIVGGGSLESSVKSVLSGIKNVHLFDWQPAEKIHEFYILSDIFVIPSRFEGLPGTVIEAMNAGLHIVYTEVGGMPDVLKGYGMKTILNQVSVTEIKKVLTHLTVNFSTHDFQDCLAYAHKFDWNNIALETNKVYLQSIDK